MTNSEKLIIDKLKNKIKKWVVKNAIKGRIGYFVDAEKLLTFIKVIKHDRNLH